jgi:hypothetical protein
MFRNLAEPRNILAEPRLKNTGVEGREVKLKEASVCLEYMAKCKTLYRKPNLKKTHKKA